MRTNSLVSNSGASAKPRQITQFFLKYIFTFSAILTVSLQSHGAPSPFHVVLDPGHGGADTGAVHSRIKESDLVLKVADKIKTLLGKNKEFKISLTRTKDQGLSLPERVKIAEGLKADLFVSLHANAAADQRAKGVELFFQNNLPPDEESLFLANQENQMAANLQTKDSEFVNKKNSFSDLSKKEDVAAIIEDLHRQNRMLASLRLNQTLSNLWENDAEANQATIKQAPFYVISKTSMPAVLVEVGFLTNPTEAKQLSNNKYLDSVAHKIYSALISYKEKMDKPEVKPLN